MSDPPPGSGFARSRAVVLGVDAYGAGIPRLRSAVADARAIAAALADGQGFEVRTGFDGEVSAAAVRALVERALPAELGADDRLLFYFAGHGIAVDGDDGPAGYLLPADARRDDPASFLAMRAVHDALAALPCRHVLIVLDCCFAGSFRWSSLRDVAPAPAPMYRERYQRFVESPAWQVLTSAAGDQAALDRLAPDRGEGGAAHSPFAAAFLAALAGGADYSGDGVMTASELAIYLRDRVEPLAEAIGRRQTPQLFLLARHDRGEFLFQVPGRALALPPAPPLDPDRNPYRGLEAFDEASAALFFGRDDVAAALAAAVERQPLTVVVGPSGSGKSSLVRAGLVPRLRAAGWRIVAQERPGDAAERLVATVTGDARALVVIDQLEELLTGRSSAAAQGRFLAALAAGLGAAPGLRLVVTVRSDVEPQLQGSALAPWWMAGRFPIPPMTRAELRDAIEKPAAACVLYFEPARLVDRLVDDVALLPAPLPLLSFALSELYRRYWERHGDDRAIRESDYEAIGSVARALTERATALHDELVARDPAHAITVRNLMLRMTTTVGGELARRRVPLAELVVPDPAEQRRTEEVLARFHAARLVLCGTEPDGESRAGTPYVEPAHDVLVRGWDKVGAWVQRPEIQALRLLARALARPVEAWLAHRRDPAYLWTSDPRLAQAAVVAAQREPMLNVDESDFVRASVRRRRARRAAGAVALAAVIAGLSAAALIASREAGRARREASRAEDNLLLEKGRRASLLARQGEDCLALEAGLAAALPFRRDGRALPPQVRQGVLDAAARACQDRVVVHAGDATAMVRVIGAFAPDGATFATAGSDGQLRVWDAVAGAASTPLLDHGAPIESVVFDGGGRVVTTGGGEVRTWDARTGQLVATRAAPAAPVAPVLAGERILATAPDGRRVLTASDRVVRVRDAATGEVVATLDAASAPPLPRTSVRLSTTDRDVQEWVSASFSPDGIRVVTATGDAAARLWDARSGALLATLAGPAGPVLTAAFSPDGARVLMTSIDGTASIRTPPWVGAAATLGGQGRARFLRDGRLVTERRGEIQLWRRATGARLASLPGRDLAIGGDGRRIIAWGDAGAEIRDASGRLLVALDTGPLRDAAFSPDGARVATASRDRTARIWDVGSGRLLAALAPHDDEIGRVWFAPDGARVVTTEQMQAVRVWDSGSGRLVARLAGHERATATGRSFAPVRDGDIAADGRGLVTVGVDGSVRLWDLASGAKTGGVDLPDAERALAAAFTPTGPRAVSATDEGTLRLWDVRTGRPLATMAGHRGMVMLAVFSPDRTRIATGGFHDHAVRLWDAATGQLLATFEPGDPVDSLAFSLDGAELAVSSNDGDTARIFIVDDDAVVAAGCAALIGLDLDREIADADERAVVAAGCAAPAQR